MTLPIPAPNADSRPYWDAAQDNRLVTQVCTSCDTAQAVPRNWCSACQSPDLTWRGTVPRGKVASFSVVHRGPTAAFRDATPYVLALVDVEDGVRLMLNILGEDREQVQIGDPVDIVFEARGDTGFHMPQARRIAG